MSEQTGQPGQATQPESPAGDRWGDPITPDWQAELKSLADQQRAWAAAPDHQGQESYFTDVELTGADVYWLAERVRNQYGAVPDLHLEQADLNGAHLEGGRPLSGASGGGQPRRGASGGGHPQ